ncbi:terminase family protein [Labrys neptuniae]|uniref:terminase large subunit domain-containing protein n=1 Tax=Labrys neptuniae TaxID=376174 RepID=UPI00288FDB11|nr:terminase family protein [Labrys neptuniae]MDT3381716.1 terminase family protein [Labrys neptuniae]
MKNSTGASARCSANARAPALKSELLRLLAEKKRRFDTNWLPRYRPYPRQADFHRAGADHRERLFMAGNQLGKTYSGGAEAAIHATGKYPDWWQGRRFTRPTVAWAAGVTGLATRDTVQRMLVGRAEAVGTGTIPGADIVGLVAARSTPGLIDSIRIRHVSGGTSTIGLKSYEQGREKWQGETLDWLWFDEEPPEDIYTEGLTRTNATGGIAWMTFTPLLGMSEVVRRFLSEASRDRSVTTMTIDDAGHYSPEMRARIVAAYPAHEREARAKGIPILGSGRIFPVEEAMIAVDQIRPEPFWPALGAMDFGWDHPFAAVMGYHDRDADVVYLTRAFRAREQTPLLHAGALRAWGDWLPWAWPHDGLQHDKGSGEQLAEQYRRQGLAMLPEHARFEDGSNGVEAGLMLLLDRMRTGRLKVSRHLNDWWEEFRLYHRKDGKVVKERDDLMSATRYLIMTLRHATLNPAALDLMRPEPQPYDPLSY